MLDVVGLTADQAALYGVLVARPSASVDELSAEVGATTQRTSALLAGLEGKGLVARQGTASSRYAASPPAVAMGALIVERHAALRRAELALETLNQTYRDATAGRRLGDVVDVVRGPSAVRQRFAQLQDGARAEVRAFVRSSVAVVPPDDNDAEARALARGVGYRFVVERELLERPGFVEEADRASLVGAQVRVARALPTRLLVVDSEIALMPMLASPQDQSGGALLVHASGLLEVLIALFERTWQVSAALTGSARRTDQTVDDDLEEVDLQILRLLNAGLTDQKASSRLGLSSRTVLRRVSRLMEIAEVDTRLQLGVAAARRGWL